MKNYAKNFLSKLLLVAIVLCSLSISAFASISERNGDFNGARPISSISKIITVEDNRSNLSIIPYGNEIHEILCSSEADIGKKLLSKSWRGEGKCTLTSMEPFYVPSLDISIITDFYYKGHYYTNADVTELQTDSCEANTKYVKGKAESDFGVHVSCSVIDDNGVKVYDNTHTKGNPFDN